MKTNFQWLLLSLSILTTSLYSQNVCLDFDGVDDYIDSPIPIGNNDFTTELWFRSMSTDTDISCSGNFERLFSFGGPNTRFELGLCGGELNIFWFETNNNQQGPTSCQAGLSYNDNLWHHIAVTRAAQTVTIYIDCVPIVCPLTVNSGFNMTTFRLGKWPGGGATPGELWLGQMDDVRIWNFAKTQVQIDAEKHCVLSGNETDLQLYYNFDEGIAGGANTGPILDTSPNGLNGVPNGFAFNGNSSNYINSTADLVYPNLNNTSIEIKDYPYQNALLTEICPEDPAHFSMLQNGAVPGPFNNVTVAWWYYDDVITNPHVQLTSPPFTDFRFGVPSGNINYDCTADTDGFVNRTFYAISTVQSNSNNEICDYKSEEYDLRICCDISPATVDIIPPDPICDNEIVTVNVCLNSPDLFVQTPGPYVDIVWMVNGNPATSLNGQLCFSHIIFPPYPSLPHDYCFKATVTNCNGKSASFQDCIRVDPEPICGTIDAMPLGSPQNLTLISTTPHLIYEICPGNDAILGIDAPFQSCNPQWQYSFDCNTWNDLGFSNSVQNTNIIPTSTWTSSSIFYQIQCNPLSNPSGCDPCFSNKVEIRLKDQPIQNSVAGGTNQLCKGASNTLSVASQNPLHTYTWFCDGLQVATGPMFTYIADKSACYWFETYDGCYAVESPPYCVEVCEVIPLMTCPLPPNECACLGVPITLDACASSSTCSNPTPNLQFTWFINNVQQPPSGCTITHTPPVAGATYRVEIVNTATGCVASTEKTVVPCDKN